MLTIQFIPYGILLQKSLISWHSNILIMILHDDDYSRSVSCALPSISTFVLKDLFQCGNMLQVIKHTSIP